MAWKPKLPQVTAEVVPVSKRPWVAVAEQHAESAVNFFVNTMRNQRLSHKIRMEAATRIVMIAGATFRGEKVDGSGRPAANLPAPSGQMAKLSHDALRQALRTLPPGAVVEDPVEAVEGERYVVIHDSDHSRKPTGHVVQSPVGSLVEGATPREQAEALMAEREEANRKKREEEKAKEELERQRLEEMNAFDALKELAKQGKKSSLPVSFEDRKLGKKRLFDAKKHHLSATEGLGGGVRSGKEAGQVEILGDSAGMADSQGEDTELPSSGSQEG